MKAVDAVGDAAVELVTVSLTGDGRREQQILKALAERYNGHDKLLQLPATVAPLGHGNKQTGRFAGFSVLQTIPTYFKFNYSKYLLLIDKEYITNSEDAPLEMKNELSALGFDPVNVATLKKQSFLIRCKLGSHNIMVHVVICGEDKCVEENIAELLFLEFRIRVEPKKPAIDQILKQKGTNLYGLIKNAEPSNLEKAFRDLVAAFKSIEKNQHC